ncbi:MAG: bacterial Ig-like domain-containing protein [Clostridia bacterium]|nr:bacterial Ig-like domain-containing protein [Clostridia bacterium]
MKAKKMVFVYILLLFICFILSSCNKKQIVNITKGENFNLEFSIDSELDLEQMFVDVEYKNNEIIAVALKECSITGFDSSTTGEKVMTIQYNGFSIDLPYTVTYDYEVKISTRLEVSVFPAGKYSYYEIRMRNFNLDKFSALSFVITNESLDALSKNIVASSSYTDLKLDKQVISNTEVGIVIMNLNDVEIENNSIIIRLQQTSGNCSNLKIKDIHLYDGQIVYNLPDTN